jgi:hypothetical protein
MLQIIGDTCIVIDIGYGRRIQFSTYGIKIVNSTTTGAKMDPVPPRINIVLGILGTEGKSTIGACNRIFDHGSGKTQSSIAVEVSSR